MHRGSYLEHGNKPWIRQFPGNDTTWGNCTFCFDPDERNYDWLVVYHDLPPRRPNEDTFASENLACEPSNTIHVNYEPSSITTYGHEYLLQFRYVLTSHEASYVKHPNRIYSQPGLPWLYGRGFTSNHFIGFDELLKMPIPNKKKVISTVCTKKKTSYTSHKLRFKFTHGLKNHMAALDVFGHDICPIDDKAEALDHYKYHLAIENHFAPHHWTEKLADAFLGYTLPIYAGCPNLDEYFPEESYVRINPRRPKEAFEIIREAIENNEYEKRLDAIIEARHLVLTKHNLFNLISEAINERNNSTTEDVGSDTIYSRPAFWKKYPLARMSCIKEKIQRRIGGILSASI